MKNEDKGQNKPVSIHDGVNRFFKDSIWSPFSSFFDDPFFKQHHKAMKIESMPSMDVSETDKEFKVEVEVPGFDPKKIEVEIEDYVLNISGEKTEDKQEKKKKYYKKERSYGSFKRSVSLPENADVQKADCNVKDGMLEIVIPKKKKNGDKNKIKLKVK